jgi:hypothetical protein
VVTLFAGQMQRWVDAGSPDWTGVDGSINRWGFTAEMTAQPLFIYGDRSFTIGDFCDHMVRSPITMTRLRRDETRVRRDLVQYFYRRAASEISRERGYLEASGYDREVRRQHEKALIMALEQEAVSLRSPIPEAELRAHYEDHADHHMAPAQATVTRIRAPALPATELLWRGLERGMGIDEALRLAGPAVETRSVVDESQVIRAGEPGWEAIEPLEAGEATELVSGRGAGRGAGRDGEAEQDGRQFVIVHEQTPARQLSFEEARPAIAAELRAAIEEERFEALIGRLREKYPVSIDTEALLELPLGG